MALYHHFASRSHEILSVIFGRPLKQSSGSVLMPGRQSTSTQTRSVVPTRAAMVRLRGLPAASTAPKVSGSHVAGR